MDFNRLPEGAFAEPRLHAFVDKKTNKVHWTLDEADPNGFTVWRSENRVVVKANQWFDKDGECVTILTNHTPEQCVMLTFMLACQAEVAYGSDPS